MKKYMNGPAMMKIEPNCARIVSVESAAGTGGGGGAGAGAGAPQCGEDRPQPTVMPTASQLQAERSAVFDLPACYIALNNIIPPIQANSGLDVVPPRCLL